MYVERTLTLNILTNTTRLPHPSYLYPFALLCSVTLVAQDEKDATHAHKMSANESRVDFSSMSAKEVFS